MAEAPKTEMLDVSKLTGDGLEVTFVLAMPGQAEKRYPMRAATMRVGRSDQADIAIKDASVSGKHCDLTKEGGRLYVKDLGSSNGTFLNGEKSQEAELRDGDVLRLGNSATLTVSMPTAGAGRAPAAPPPMNNENAGSTAMISANDLNAMRAGNMPPMRAAPPPAAPARRTAAAPPPIRQPLPRDNEFENQNKSKTGLIIGIAVAVVVVLIAAVGAVMFMKSKAHAADVAVLDRVQKETAAIIQTKPCTAVQDSVMTLIKLERDAGVSAPTPPVKPKERPNYQKFVDVERDKARQYKRIAGTVEQLVTTTQVTIDRIKSDIGGIGDEALKAQAGEIATALEERMQLSADFVSGWKRLQTETDKYADLAEAAYVRGGGDVNAFSDFRFAKQAPMVLGACNKSHDDSKKALEEKLAALTAVAK